MSKDMCMYTETEHMKGSRIQEIENEPVTCFLLYHHNNIAVTLKEFSLASILDITLLVNTDLE